MREPERTTRITRRFAAPVSVVYRALLDSESITRWKFPVGMSIRIHAFEPQEGGRFRVSLTYRDAAAIGKTAANTDTYHGNFQQLVEGFGCDRCCNWTLNNFGLSGTSSAVEVADAGRSASPRKVSRRNLDPVIFNSRPHEKPPSISN
jgi:hypothetical protein